MDSRQRFSYDPSGLPQRKQGGHRGSSRVAAGRRMPCDGFHGPTMDSTPWPASLYIYTLSWFLAVPSFLGRLERGSRRPFCCFVFCFFFCFVTKGAKGVFFFF